jgi:hypothetical protein
MKKRKPFQIPKALLTQINECSKGFFLVTISEEDKFDIHQCLDNPVLNMAMMNFLEVYSTAQQQNIRDRTTEALEGGDEEDQD